MAGFITARNRDAYGPIRGYVYQVDLAIERWLNLGPNMALELERGEDIDTVTEAMLKHGVDQERLLEQIKARESNLTLRSAQAVEALASFHEHLQTNPGLDLIFRYVTNAQVGVEKNRPYRKGFLSSPCGIGYAKVKLTVRIEKPSYKLLEISSSP